MVDRIGFVGLGRMGGPMARRLRGAGYDLAVWNRTPSRAEELKGLGASVLDSPAEVARRSQIVFSMLADDSALRTVTLGVHGLLDGSHQELILVDMSTVSPAVSAEIAEACAARGVSFLRAPVMGSTGFAEAGTLGILVSGPRPAFDSAVEVLRAMGSSVFYLGAGEEARHMKLAVNMLIGTTMVALAETLVLGEKAGLDWGQMLEILSGGTAGSPFVRYKARQLSTRDMRPTFTLELMRKDLDLALDAARHLEAATPLTSLSRQIFQAAIGAGWGELDVAAVLLFIEQSSGVRLASPPLAPVP